MEQDDSKVSLEDVAGMKGPWRTVGLERSRGEGVSSPPEPSVPSEEVPTRTVAASALSQYTTCPSAREKVERARCYSESDESWEERGHSTLEHHLLKAHL